MKKIVYYAFLLTTLNFVLMIMNVITNSPISLKKTLGFSDELGLFEIISIIIFIVFAYLYRKQIREQTDEKNKMY